MRTGIELRKAILRNCHYFHPMVPETVHGKPWIEGDTEKMIDDTAYWTMTPGAKWHGFEGYGENQFLMDPVHLQLMTPSSVFMAPSFPSSSRETIWFRKRTT